MQYHAPRRAHHRGFTLVEVAIVVLVIGLVIGGIFAGKALIKSAQVRAQTGQIAAYDEAASIFRVKYGALPGDLKADRASSLDFIARSGGVGCGDGNGAIEGITNHNDIQTDCQSAGVPTPGGSIGNEWFFFWSDLSRAQMVAFAFDDTVMSSDGVSKLTMELGLGKTLPTAKLGKGYGYVAVNGGANSSPLNYYLLNFTGGTMAGNPARGIPAQDAFIYDSKVDDGLPMTGNVQAISPPVATDLGSSSENHFFLPAHIYARACPAPGSFQAFLGSLLIAPAYANADGSDGCPPGYLYNPMDGSCAPDCKNGCDDGDGDGLCDGNDPSICYACGPDPGCMGAGYNNDPLVCACNPCPGDPGNCVMGYDAGNCWCNNCVDPGNCAGGFNSDPSVCACEACTDPGNCANGYDTNINSCSGCLPCSDPGGCMAGYDTDPHSCSGCIAETCPPDPGNCAAGYNSSPGTCGCNSCSDPGSCGTSGYNSDPTVCACNPLSCDTSQCLAPTGQVLAIMCAPAALAAMVLATVSALTAPAGAGWIALTIVIPASAIPGTAAVASAPASVTRCAAVAYARAIYVTQIPARAGTAAAASTFASASKIAMARAIVMILPAMRITAKPSAVVCA